MAIVVNHPLTNSHSSALASASYFAPPVKAVARVVRLWRSRIRERHAISMLDDFALHDLPLSRWEVERELAKPFWRG